jgi:hypothetical protein
MHKSVFRPAVQWALAGALLGATIGGTTAGAFTRGCAARDLQILMLIEQQESTNTVSAEKLNDALLTMLHARMVCHEGHVVDALAIYNSISETITAPCDFVSLASVAIGRALASPRARCRRPENRS